MRFVLVGDSITGKNVLLTRYEKKEYPSYIPVIVENYSMKVVVEGISCNVMLYDTTGLKQYQRLRPLSYPSTDVFILCYSICNRDSFDNIKDAWHAEIKIMVQMHRVFLLELNPSQGMMNQLIK